jgi:hypothetical protein
MQKISPPTGIRSPDSPVRSESLYRLSYRGPHRFLIRSDEFPFLPNVWGPFLSNTYRGNPLSEVKRSKREADCSPPFNEEVSHAYILTHVFRDESKPMKTLTVTNKSTNSRSVSPSIFYRSTEITLPRLALSCSRISRKKVRDSTAPLI